MPRPTFKDLELFDAVDYLLDGNDGVRMSASQVMVRLLNDCREGVNLPSLEGLDYSDYLDLVRKHLERIGAVLSEEAVCNWCGDSYEARAWDFVHSCIEEEAKPA